MLIERQGAVIMDMTVSAILVCGRSAVLAERHAKPRADRCHSLDRNGKGNEQDKQRAKQAFWHRFRVYRSFWTPSQSSRLGSAKATSGPIFSTGPASCRSAGAFISP